MEPTFADLGTERYVFGGSALYLLLGRHVEKSLNRLFGEGDW